MTVGMSAFTADGYLNAIANNNSFQVSVPYMKLHVGDPGAAGAGSPAVETSRKAVSFGNAAAGAAGFRQVANDVAVSWVGINGTEDATHFSLWDTIGPTGGNFLGSGTITANGYNAGDTYTIAIGGCTLTLAIAT